MANERAFLPDDLAREDPGPPRSAASRLRPLLSLDDVANFLGVSQKTVRRWMLSKRLPHVRLGRVVRFRQDELLRWIEARREV